jgi:hypothetical protein
LRVPVRAVRSPHPGMTTSLAGAASWNHRARTASVEPDRATPPYPSRPRAERTVETGGDGDHYYYLAERELPTRPGLLPGLDLKGEGGFVVAPPSLHASGKRYRWAPRRGPHDLSLVAAPRWLLAPPAAKPPAAGNVTDLRISEGGRNTHLAFAGRARRRGPRWLRAPRRDPRRELQSLRSAASARGGGAHHREHRTVSGSFGRTRQ